MDKKELEHQRLVLGKSNKKYSKTLGEWFFMDNEDKAIFEKGAIYSSKELEHMKDKDLDHWKKVHMIKTMFKGRIINADSNRDDFMPTM